MAQITDFITISYLKKIKTLFENTGLTHNI